MYDINTRNIKKGLSSYFTFLLLSLLFVVIFGSMIVSKFLTVKSLDAEVISTSVDVGEHYDDEGALMYLPVYHYIVNGVEYACPSSISSNIYPGDDNKTVYYNSKNPAKCMTEYSKSNSYFYYIGLGVAIIFVLFTAFNMLKINKRLKAVEELKQHGKLVKNLPYRMEATGTSVSSTSNFGFMRVSNNSPLLRPVVDYTLSNGSTVTLYGDARYDRRTFDADGMVDLVIDENVYKVVQEIFDMYGNKGMSTIKIADELNRRNIVPPAVYMNMPCTKRKCKNPSGEYVWLRTTIGNMLKNQTYLGYVVSGKREQISPKIKKGRQKKKEEFIVIKNMHDPIIDEELWKKVQDRFNSFNTDNKKKYNYILKGMVYCGECGNSLKVTNTEKRKKRTIHFYCIHYKEGERDFSFGVYLSKIDKVIKDILKDIIKNYLDTDEIIDKIVNGILKDDKVESKISNLQNIITQNRLQIKNQYIMKTNGDITLEQFLKFKEEKNNLIEKNEKIIEQLNVKYDKDSLIKLVKEKYESFTEDEEVFNIVVKELIEKIILYRDRTIKINFKFKKLDSYSIKLY